MNGGYCMVDCTGLVLTNGNNQTINGIYKQIDAAAKSGKPIWAYNCGYNDGVLSPVPGMVLYEGDEYCFTSSILQVWVAEDDVCRVVSLLS